MEDDQSDVAEENSFDNHSESQGVWSFEESKMLICNVMGLFCKKPYHYFDIDGNNIQWEKVAFSPFSAEKCKEHWKTLSQEVIHFRTTSDVAYDIFKNLGEIMLKKQKFAVKQANATYRKVMCNKSKASKVENKLAVKKQKENMEVDPDFPKAPFKSAYMIFSKEKLQQKTDLKGPALIKAVAEVWKNLSKQEKEPYFMQAEEQRRDYIHCLEDYIADHPDKDKAKVILEKSRKQLKLFQKSHGREVTDSDVGDDHNSSPQKNNSNLGLNNFAETPKKTKKKIHSTEFVESGVDDEDNSSPQKGSKRKYDDSITESPKKKNSSPDFPEDSVPETPKKRKKQDEVADGITIPPIDGNLSETPVETPTKSKKKKSKKKTVTALSLFIEAKQEAYSLKYPDLDESTIWAKLTKKFLKLPQHKQDKYEALAAEQQ